MSKTHNLLKKNYFVNMGTEQGVRQGTQLAVYRTIFKVNSYDNNIKYDYKIPIGLLKVIHSEQNASIAKLLALAKVEDTPQLDIEEFMIGDTVTVDLK